MNILLDENLPRQLARELPGHAVSTVQQMGWTGISNGKLLALAQDHFDALITVDRNLQYQNVIAKFQIALMVVRVPSTRVADVLSKAPAILAALPALQPGTVTLVP